MYDMYDVEAAERLFENTAGSPRLHSCGRTLNDNFIILDEAQNTTPEQMKMFLTRIVALVVVTGDTPKSMSRAEKRLRDVNKHSTVCLISLSLT